MAAAAAGPVRRAAAAFSLSRIAGLGGSRQGAADAQAFEAPLTPHRRTAGVLG